jgi:hypothetical protein
VMNSGCVKLIRWNVKSCKKNLTEQIRNNP